LVTAVLVVATASAMAQTAPPPSVSVPPRMMTDSAEYCAHLANEVARVGRNRGSASPEVQSLADEGNRMCSVGHYRQGVHRLRRALALWRSGH